MHEKRRALRYVPGRPVELQLVCGTRELSAPLSDLSSGGLMTLVPDAEIRQWQPGARVGGEIRMSEGALSWEGEVIHSTSTARGFAVGIATRNSTDTIRTATEWLSKDPSTGALHIRRTGTHVELEVIGRLSFEIARDFLYLVRKTDVSKINLAHCTSIDSSGLGMLSIAHELRLPIEGANGIVSALIDVARIRDAARR